MRLRIVSLLSLACASALLVTGCNQSIVTTSSGPSGNNGASYIFAENFNPATQEGTIQSFPITQVPISTVAVAPAATTTYPGSVASISCSPCGSGYTVAPPITVAPPTTLPANGGSTATAVATLNSSGGIATITVTYGGSGYTATPLVTVPPAPAGAVQAALTATSITASTNPPAFQPVTIYSSATATIPAVPSFLNAQVYDTQLTMDSVADGRLFFASYPWSLPNVVTVHFVTAPNPPTVIAENGGVSSIALTTAGAGYSTPPAIVIAPPSAPGGTQATAVATLSSSTGPVSSTTVTTNGTGYTTAPTVTFTAPTTVGGTTATGTATVASGGVTGITLTNAGSGYDAAPTISFTGGGGTGAVATAAVAAPYGALSGITVTYPGTGYTTTAPSVSIAAPPAASATAVINGSGVVTAINVDNGGIGYTTPPAVTLAAPNSATAAAVATYNAAGQLTGLTVTNPGFGYTTAPAVTVAPQFVAPAPAPAAAATITAGAVTAVTMTAGGADYLNPPTVTFSGGGGTGATGTAVISVAGGGIVTGVNITNPGSGYTTAPTISFSTPPTPVAATATAVISGGEVTGFTNITPGSGYTSTPNVTIAGPSGTATATAGTPVLNSSGTITSIPVSSGGSGYLTAPTVTIAGNGMVQAAATAVAVGPISVGALTIGRTVTDQMQSNFKSMTSDRAENVYVSEANGHMIVIPTTATGQIQPTGTGSVSPASAVADYDMSKDAAGSGASAINPTGVGASNTGFDLMATDLDENLYTYVAGSGVITEYNFNATYNFPPFTSSAVCPVGTTQCYVGSTAVTSPPVFPTANRTITLPSSVTNVVDFVTDNYGNLYVLAQNGGPGQATVTEYAPCTATCSPSAIKTIGGANTGFNIPGSLAVDTVGNVYVEDFSVTSPTLNDFLIFTSVESGNVAPSLSFTETVPNTLPSPATGKPTGYGLAVY